MRPRVRCSTFAGLLSVVAWSWKLHTAEASMLSCRRLELHCSCQGLFTEEFTDSLSQSNDLMFGSCKESWGETTTFEDLDVNGRVILELNLKAIYSDRFVSWYVVHDFPQPLQAKVKIVFSNTQLPSPFQVRTHSPFMAASRFRRLYLLNLWNWNSMFK
jgi:hypothetical protein